MKITGKVLNVGDGDAIIIHVQKETKDLLIVIDGGDTTWGKKVSDEVDGFCKKLKKEAPDLIVCTHYDSDHIAGIITLIEKYQNKIKMIWIDQPKGVVKEALRAAPNVLAYIQSKKNMLTKINEFSVYQNYLASPNYEKYGLVLESLTQLNTVIELIKKYNIPTKEPIAGKCEYTGWEEIKVIGPTQEYYNKVFLKQNNLLQIFQEEYEDLLLESKKVKAPASTNPCDLLKKTSNITPTNKASAIIRFDCEDGKYLFTGDAGIESLKSVIGYPESITKMKFLKIPHHGSNNNMSKELVDIILPKIAYNSGDGYEDKEVIDCIKRVPGIVVKTTKADSDLDF
jgi:beta-lactamase superfamily II metal-dependent hydrolase